MWRRWDPHVHLPGTLLNDQFSGMSVAEALEVLADRQPPIAAIGVTDYFTTATFRKAVDALEDGVARTIELAFPNVELRLDNATSDDRGVNAHLMCAPQDVDLLDDFLGRLEFSYADREYRADHDGLVRLGRDYRNDPTLPEESALRVGAEQFKVNFEALRKVLRTDGWARRSLLLGVAAGKDGSSGLRRADGAFDARRQSIEAVAGVIFSGNPKDSQFWSGLGKADELDLERVYGGPKLCLHGSDAHDAGRLGAPDDDRFCWLNGDATFETLKFACLSPQTRSHIGRDKPSDGQDHGRIIEVSVPDNTWFVNETVPLNPGLVAVIGPRGSGKTALADLIAAGAGSAEPFENPRSFVTRAGRLLEGSVAAVRWSHEEVTTCNLSVGYAGPDFVRPVRYLSQQFVEQLCAADGVSDELIEEIERVIFEAWPVERRQGATNFRELLELRLQSARRRRSAELDAVLELSDAITGLRVQRRRLPSLRSELEEKEKELRASEAQINELLGKADKDSADRLELVSGALRRRQGEAQNLDRRRASLVALREAIETMRETRFPMMVETLRKEHEAARLNEVQWDAFAVGFQGDVEEVIRSGLASAEQQMADILGPQVDKDSPPLDALGEQELLAQAVNVLAAERERLRMLVGLDATRTKALTALQAGTAATRDRVVRLKEAIEAAENVAVSPLIERRLEHYKNYFRALLAEEAELRALYQPLDEILHRFGATVAKLKFDVKREVDVEAWAKRGEDLLDLRMDGPFRGGGKLAAAARQALLPAWELGDEEQAAEAIGKFSSDHSDNLRQQQRRRGDGNESDAEWEGAVSRWLYSTDHIRLRYNLDYDGLGIERLSPGSRGIVLLLLYLAVDQEESDPLIIDQPEENLDPESVYNELVDLFRDASRRRQIIMVTHNANLVINTDVDQVVIAKCGPLAEGRLPELSYLAGGLEDPKIRAEVCEVLEGGAAAFRDRARRLGLDLTVTGSEEREDQVPHN